MPTCHSNTHRCRAAWLRALRAEGRPRKQSIAIMLREVGVLPRRRRKPR